MDFHAGVENSSAEDVLCLLFGVCCSSDLPLLAVFGSGVRLIVVVDVEVVVVVVEVVVVVVVVVEK